MSLRTPALAALALVLIGFLENTFFGSDTAGTAKHDISVVFFLVAVLGLVLLVGTGVAAVVRRVRTTA